MYKDFFPPVSALPPVPVVAVITRNERVTPAELIDACHRYGATQQDEYGERYWVVFEDDPKRPWDFTEKSLRASADQEGYLKCDSYNPDEDRILPDETPDYLWGVGH